MTDVLTKTGKLDIDTFRRNTKGRQKTTSPQPKREASEESKPGDTWISDFSASRTVREGIPVVKPQSP